MTMVEIERAAIVDELRRQHGRVDAAAVELGMSRTTFYRRLAAYEIKPEEYGCCNARAYAASGSR